MRSASWPARRAAIAVAAAALAAGAAEIGPPADATVSGRPGLIAYTLLTYAPALKASGYIGPGNIHVVDGGGHDQALTGGPADDREPAFSSDGRRIAFASNRASGPSRRRYSLFAMNVDGSGLRRLPTPLRRVDAPAWSPDGRTIAFAGDRGVYAIGADGKRLRLITRQPKGRIYLEPAWLPDGHSLLFTRARISATHNTAVSEALWIVNADGSGARALIGGIGPLRYSQQPDVSPDGAQITFLASNAAYLAQIDGRGVRRLAEAAAPGFLNGPSFSPDGARIVVSRANGATARDGAALLSVDVATGVATTITSVARGGLFAPNWQPLR